MTIKCEICRKHPIKHKDYRNAVERLNIKMEKCRFNYCINLPKSNDQLDALVQASFAWDMIVDKDTGDVIDPAYGIASCV